MDWLVPGIIVFTLATIIHCWGRTAQWARIWRTIRYGAPNTRYPVSRGGGGDEHETIELVPTARPNVDFDKVIPSTCRRGGGPAVTARNGHALAED